MRQSWSGRATGGERSITCCTSVKIAVVAPMPRARVRTATMVTYLSDVDGIYYSLGMVKNRSGPFEAAYLGMRIFAEGYYFVVLALFLFAIPIIVRSNFTGYRIGLYLVLYFTFVYLVYFGNARYHFALMPWIVIYAGIGAERLLKNGWRGETVGAEPILP